MSGWRRGGGRYTRPPVRRKWGTKDPRVAEWGGGPGGEATPGGRAAHSEHKAPACAGLRLSLRPDERLCACVTLGGLSLLSPLRPRASPSISLLVSTALARPTASMTRTSEGPAIFRPAFPSRPRAGLKSLTRPQLPPDGQPAEDRESPIPRTAVRGDATY